MYLPIGRQVLIAVVAQLVVRRLADPKLNEVKDIKAVIAQLEVRRLADPKLNEVKDIKAVIAQLVERQLPKLNHKESDKKTY